VEYRLSVSVEVTIVEWQIKYKAVLIGINCILYPYESIWNTETKQRNEYTYNKLAFGDYSIEYRGYTTRFCNKCNKQTVWREAP